MIRKILKTLFFHLILFNTLYATSDIITTSVMSSPEGEKIFFETQSQSSIALFQRKDKWILIFDTADKIDLEALKSSQILSEATIIPATTTIIHFTLKDDEIPKISSYKMGWMLDINKNKENLCKDIPLEEQDHQYVLKTETLTEKISFRDPLSEDEIFAFPSKTLHEGIKSDHNYMNFSLLKTLQGVIINPKIDHIEINKTDHQLLIKVPEQLMSSKEDLHLYKHNPESITLEFEKNAIDRTLFYEKKQELTNKITNSPTETQTQYRLEYAKFLIGFAFGNEAVDYLDYIKATDEKISSSSLFLMMSGVANLLSQNLEEAKHFFSNAKIKENKDVIFYLSLINALQKNPFKTTDLSTFMKLSSFLPSPLKINIGLKILEAAAEAHLFDIMHETMDILSKESIQKEDQELIDYYKALMYENEDAETEANRIFQKLASSHNSKIYVLAQLHLATKDLSNDDKRLKAIQSLEKLRLLLTEGPIETKILEKLADLYLLNQDWIKALRTWNKLLRYYPGYTQKALLIKKMREVFLKQYSSQLIKNIPIFIAIGLFEEFSYLIDTLADSNKIVLNLTNVAESFNLNEKALILLNQQIKKNVDETAEKMHLLLRRAQMQSRIGKDRDVLQTISLIKRDLLSSSDQQKFDFLKTSTLYALGEITLDHDILPDNNSYEAHDFRARVYWSLKEWSKAADSLKKALDLSSPEMISTQYHVLYYAIAVRYTGDYILLRELRNFYLSQLEKSPLQELFNLVTTQETIMENLNIPDLKKAIEEVKELEKFMAEYKKQKRQ